MPKLRFNAPPGWNVPPFPWEPPRDFRPDPTWPAPPPGWRLWVPLGPSELPEKLNQDGNAASGDYEVLRKEIESELREQLVELNDRLIMQEAGVYTYHHPLETAAAYKQELECLQHQIRQLIKSNRAILASSSFVYENSAAKGTNLIRQLSGLALLAFNQEVENCLRTLKAGSLPAAVKRIHQSSARIEKFGEMMSLRLNPEFLGLRLRELELTADYLAKKQQEKELERERRAQLREEARARRELEEQREQLEKERDHYLNAIAALEEKGDIEKTGDLKEKLVKIESAISENDFRVSNIRAGYVYIISNEGAFGPGVVKIGMTRRLDPMERVIELGDASVPFKFSVHAMFFSDDAISLEARLHETFKDRRLNRVNVRKEFFFASAAEVRSELIKSVGALLEFNEDPPSEEYWQSKGEWPSRSL